ncbi:MAG: hypothetical protein IJL76_03760 [Bacilli bacterium]|nr:hypothetical protein [Bacilli bacterium]
MKMIPIKNNGVLYGRCYVNKKNIVNSLYFNRAQLYKNFFTIDMRINARMLKRKKFTFDKPIPRYRAHNQLDNEKFLDKGKMLIIE